MAKARQVTYSRYQPRNVTLKVSPVAHGRLAAIAEVMARQENRYVTYSEALMKLEDLYDMAVEAVNRMEEP